MDMTNIKIARVTRRFGVPLVSLTALLAGCSGGGGNAPGNPGTVVNPAKGDLRLSVGTANIFGDTPAAAVVGLNVVETFRQVAGEQHTGDTNVLVNSPTLSGPFTLPATPGTPDANGTTIESGPGPADAGKNVMTSTGQPDPGAPAIAASTFGVSTNASGFGLEPFNYTSVNGNNAGSPLSYVPYVQPLFDPAFDPTAGTSDLNAFTPWGGPPAYDPDKTGLGVRDGNPNPPGVLGVSLGLDVFQGVSPVGGTYTLSAAIPKTGGGTTTSTATTALNSVALLPAIAPPTVTLDGNGGGSLTVAFPAGVTEALIQIEDIGPAAPADGGSVTGCNSANLVPAYYTIEATASGTYALPDAIGPGTPASPGVTLCSPAQNLASSTAGGSTETAVAGDTFIVQTIGYDYPAYEASYPSSNGNPAPTISGANGQSDITISSADACVDSGTAAAGCGPAAASGSAIKRANARLRSLMLKHV